jgi:hypothetical protein
MDVESVKLLTTFFVQFRCVFATSRVQTSTSGTSNHIFGRRLLGRYLYVCKVGYGSAMLRSFQPLVQDMMLDDERYISLYEVVNPYTANRKVKGDSLHALKAFLDF